MLGWIIYKTTSADLTPEAYEINRLTEVAEAEGIQLKVIRPEQVDLIVTQEDRKSVQLDGQPISLPDFVLPRMGAGTTYFALAVIRHFERLGVNCFNTANAIDTVKDKLFTHQILAEKNIPVPKTMLAKFPLDVEMVRKQFGFPVVVKTLSGSQGKGVFLSRTEKEFTDLIQLVEVTNPATNLIIQEFVKTSFGRDIRVLTLGGAGPWQLWNDAPTTRSSRPTFLWVGRCRRSRSRPKSSGWPQKLPGFSVWISQA